MVKSDFSCSFRFNEMARPAGLEHAAPWFEDTQYKTLSAASGVACRGTRHFISLLSWTEMADSKVVDAPFA